MTYNEFKNKYMGKGIDFDGYYGFQCMDLAHQYAVEVVGKDFKPAPAAKDVWNQTIDGYDKIANTPTGVPQQGDIIIWGVGVGPYGHIAVFDNGDSNSFVSLDQNWPVNSITHLQNHNYNGVLGWFHPQVKVNEPMATITQKELDEIRTARDINWTNLQIEKSQNTLLVTRIEELKKENENIKTESAKLSTDLTTCLNAQNNPPTPIVEPSEDILTVGQLHDIIYSKWTWYGIKGWKNRLHELKKVFES